MDISFTTTAMARPDIIDRTYKSFSNNIHGIDLKSCDLYINIDPLPLESDPNDVVLVAKKYFNNVIYNIPSEPNFTRAVEWVWEHAASEYIFHLEDDWILTSAIDISKMIKSKMVGDVSQIVLRAYSYKYDKIALSPSLIKRGLYKSFVGKFDYDINPEVQLRREWVRHDNIVESGKDIIVKDIGRKWIQGKSYQKPPKKSNFNKWELM